MTPEPTGDTVPDDEQSIPVSPVTDHPQFPATSAANPLAMDCRRCPDLVESRERIAWGNGPLDASIVVVGEAPGAGDPDADRWGGGNWTGMAYTARHSGRRIRATLAAVGFGPDACYFTNAVKCYPGDGSGSNREPTAEERSNCRPHLLTEIETIDPSAIVATGRHATQTLLALENRPLDGFLEVVLEVLDCPTVGTPVVPVLHPSYRDVWLARLGHTEASYLAALRGVLDGVV